MAEIVTLADAIAATVHDGDTVAMEGFTHLIPHAAGHEVIALATRGIPAARLAAFDQALAEMADNLTVGLAHMPRDKELRTVTAAEG